MASCRGGLQGRGVLVVYHLKVAKLLTLKRQEEGFGNRDSGKDWIISQLLTLTRQEEGYTETQARVGSGVW